MHRRARGVLFALGVSMALTGAACGTRLPDSAFVQAAQGGGGTGGAPGAAQASVAPTASGPAQGGAGGGASVVAGGGGAAGSGPGKNTAQGGGKQPSGQRNTASDVGVTPTRILVGNVSSINNPFDPLAFVGPELGASAYFQYLDEHGGVNGRAIVMDTCDDRGDGGQNQTCVRGLIDNSKVFAFVSNAVFDYQGADYVQSKGVPDIGGQPISNAYNQYSHFFSIYGVPYPRNGQVGYNGKLYGGTENYRFFKTHFPNVPLKAGVVYYNESTSAAFAAYIDEALRKEGYSVDSEQVDFALPDYNSAVIHMKSQGVQYVYDVLDVSGNEALCRAMDDNGLVVKAKVTTTQGWTQNVEQGYAQSPKCRNSLYAIGMMQNFDDLANPQVAQFRAAVHRYGYDGVNQLSDWELEGWGGAMWFTDAVRSCGVNVTRKCVEAYLDQQKPKWYDGHGLMTPRDFQVLVPAPSHITNCINVVHWQDSANGGQGGWVNVVPNMDSNCFDVPNLPYAPD